MEYRHPSAAFVGAAWLSLLVGSVGCTVGLWNAPLTGIDKAAGFILLMYGLFSAVSVQKSIRDRLDGIPVTTIFYGLSWVSLFLCIACMTWALTFTLETVNAAGRGFYAMGYLMSLFAAITVQKNTRDSDPATMPSAA
jgi:uncharacterized membrane protein YiaA